MFDRKAFIPNTITLLNLLCGCFALAALWKDAWWPAMGWALGSQIADFLDGFAARGLKVSGPIGKQLDSLADMVSFGVVPGAIFYLLLAAGSQEMYGLYWAALPGFIVSAFSALRLAKFNIDTRQTDFFMGLPTPACTLFAWGVLWIAHSENAPLAAWVQTPLVLYTMVAALSWLMVAEWPMFSLKFKSLGWAGNEIRYIFAAVSLLLLFSLKGTAIPLIIVFYILISGIFHRQILKK